MFQEVQFINTAWKILEYKNNFNDCGFVLFYYNLYEYQD